MQLFHPLTLTVSALATQAAETAATAAVPTDPDPDLGTTHMNTCQEITPGSSCAGSEGLWNCMGNAFQRCGSGQWGVVQSCALGTRCEPVGLTFQFHVDFADGGTTSPSPSPPLPTTTTTAATSSAERNGVQRRGGLWILCGLGTVFVFVLAL